MQSVTDSVKTLYNFLPAVLPKQIKEVETVIIRESTMALAGRNFVRLAGLSGSVAVCMAAYGAHGMSKAEEKKKRIYDIGNNFHLIHSVALLGTPLCNRPILVGGLMTMGTLVFCGSCYVYSLTGNDRIRYVTPYGGMMLIVAWLLMVL
ncbi:transmembrane protein 256 homolog [Mizuhopecten yessoensis]|uniref:Transmembrane protein 256 n=1 Tax=Mizuhopecten yessoensis TaxID=6573 RepID=A0A210QLS4_MIZYE|nr:transmembrane protein 256 homolog [Mizuhopecten yessoensis]OWF49687.1 Transmembrane protein 256 [Mizuhopecten yessoensis]